MSSIAVNAITDANAGNTTTINGVTPNSANVVGKNKIINGNMAISQRFGTTSTTVTTTAYSLDRWRFAVSQANKISFQQQTISSPQSCGNNQFTMNVTSLAATVVGASDYWGVNQFVEANNVSDLGWGTSNAKTVTLSFWVYSSLTGAFGGSIRTGDSANYSYPFSYSIPTANTWTQISITIPGPTAGTWGTNGNGRGLDVFFSHGSGSTFSGTAGSWAAANYLNTTGSVNLVETNGATWYITGVQLEAGESATEFEHRPYGTELALCQRYYWQRELFNLNSTTAFWEGYFGGGTGVLNIDLPVVMRASPTLTVYAPTQVQVYESSGWTDRTIAVQYSTPEFVTFNVNSTTHAYGKLLTLTGGSTTPIGKINAEL
jgi:hypothetical protein